MSQRDIYYIALRPPQFNHPGVWVMLLNTQAQGLKHRHVVACSARRQKGHAKQPDAHALRHHVHRAHRGQHPHAIVTLILDEAAKLEGLADKSWKKENLRSASDSPVGQQF